jgi:uncharacterized protein
MPASPTLVRSGLWRWLDGHGCERFELKHLDGLWRLSGTVVGLAETGPAEARYEVTCDAGWRTVCATVALRDDGGDRTLDVRAESGRWTVDGRVLPSLDGCEDVDLEWSPSTNTLPIRRLDLPVGGATGELRMAWVRFPSLALEPLPQEYRRTAAGRYHFSSGGGSFATDIDVDADGLVLRYEGGWERVGLPQETHARRGSR